MLDKHVNGLIYGAGGLPAAKVDATEDDLVHPCPCILACLCLI